MRYRFRAWHKTTKTMLYEDRVGDVFSWLKEGQPIEIMQWTGLYDKNGKEIYEGDIITDSKNRIGKIIFDSGAFIVDYGMGAYYNDALCVLLNRFIRFEVTGNIHEKEKPL